MARNLALLNRIIQVLPSCKAFDRDLGSLPPSSSRRARRLGQPDKRGESAPTGARRLLQTETISGGGAKVKPRGRNQFQSSGTSGRLGGTAGAGYRRLVEGVQTRTCPRSMPIRILAPGAPGEALLSLLFLTVLLERAL